MTATSSTENPVTFAIPVRASTTDIAIRKFLFASVPNRFSKPKSAPGFYVFICHCHDLFFFVAKLDEKLEFSKYMK
jgi:hypothetical protein